MTSQAAREKMRRYRERMCRQGLRPIQIWVADTRAPGFEEELQRQVHAIARSKQEKEDQAFVDAISAEWP